MGRTEPAGIGVGRSKKTSWQPELGGFTGVPATLMQTDLPAPFWKRLAHGMAIPQHRDGRSQGSGFPWALQKAPVMCINEVRAKRVLQLRRGMSIFDRAS